MTDPCNCDDVKALQSELETLGSACDKMRIQHAETCRGLDDEVSRLGSELAELRAAAYPVLAWVARNGGGRAAVERLERVLAKGREVEPEAEVVHAIGNMRLTETYAAWRDRPAIDWDLCTCPKGNPTSPTRSGSAIVVGHGPHCGYIAARCDRDKALIDAHKAAGGEVDWAGEPKPDMSK